MSDGPDFDITLIRAYGGWPAITDPTVTEMPPFDVMLDMLAEEERAFRALPVEEQERIRTEEKAAYEAQRCEHCGCHPDEHGGY